LIQSEASIYGSIINYNVVMHGGQNCFVTV